MAKPRSVMTLFRKRTGKKAEAILNKVDKMLKKKVPRRQIEKVLSEELIAYMKAEVRRCRIAYPPPPIIY